MTQGKDRRDGELLSFGLALRRGVWPNIELGGASGALGGREGVEMGNIEMAVGKSGNCQRKELAVMNGKAYCRRLVGGLGSYRNNCPHR